MKFVDVKNDADKRNWTKEELEAYDNVGIRAQMDRSHMSLMVKKALKQVTIQAVTTLLKAGVAHDIVAQSLGLTIDEVRQIENN